MQSKFKLLTLVLLSTTFFLTSCGDSTSNPTTPSVPSVNTDKKALQHHLIKKMMQVQIGTHQKKK